MDWQLVVVLVCLAGAVAYLIRRAVRLVTARSKGCGSGACGGCPSKASDQRDFLPADSLGPVRPKR